MSDVSEFLQSYNETLRQEIAGVDLSPELTERFAFDSCVKKQARHGNIFEKRSVWTWDYLID